MKNTRTLKSLVQSRSETRLNSMVDIMDIQNSRDLEKRIEHLSTEEDMTNDEIIKWAKENNLLKEIKETRFWEVAINENPLLTAETLEYHIQSTEKGEKMLKQQFKDLHNIPWNGSASSPYWLDSYFDEVEGVYKDLTDDMILEHVEGMCNPTKPGTIISGTELKATDEKKKYKYIGTASGPSEAEVQAEDGSTVIYQWPHNFFKVFKPIKEPNK